jgi:CRISPR-associated protein Csy1
MSEETTKFETWNDVIVDFFENKVATSKVYKTREYIEKKEKEIKSEKNKKKLERQNKAKSEKQIELKYLRKEAPSTEIRQWIEKTSNTTLAKGKRIIKASHVLKFFHGSSVSDGILVDEKSDEAVLTTSSFKKELIYDLAHNNGALITISRFLALKLSGKMIIDFILKDDFEFLESFYKDKKQFDDWKKGLSNLVEQREIKTADKAKQIYYPLIKSSDQASLNQVKYRLIVPLFPTSLAEEIYTNITDLKFGKK